MRPLIAAAPIAAEPLRSAAAAADEAAASAARPVATPAALPADRSDAEPPVDDTADVPEALESALARRAELLLLVARERDQTEQAKLDRIRSAFDEAQQTRAEQLREMNSLRDMATEQMKKDDEVLKKFITMI